MMDIQISTHQAVAFTQSEIDQLLLTINRTYARRLPIENRLALGNAWAKLIEAKQLMGVRDGNQ